jgi:UDP-glucose 4-epimerase
MRYLVTGGAGFLGSHVVDRLLARGDRVEVLDDLSTGCRENLERWVRDSRFALHVGCVTDRELVARRVAGVDRVLHLAAVVGVPRVLAAPAWAMRVNTVGSEAVLAAAAERGVPVVLASSSEVYGDGHDREAPFAEDDPIRLGSTDGLRGGYGCAKAWTEWLGEAVRRERELPVIVVRLFNVAGPRQRASQGMVIARLCAQAVAGEPLTVYGDGRQTRCFAHVHDVADAVIGLNDTPSAWGQTFNVGSAEEVSVRALAERILARSGSASDIVHVAHVDVHPADARDVRRRVPDLARLVGALGPRVTRSLDELIDDTLAWSAAGIPGAVGS